MFESLLGRFSKSPKNSTHNFVGAESFRTRNPYILDCYDEDKYASIYPSVKAIASEFMKLQPKAIGSNGEPKQNIPALNALYHPNQLDSSVAFREKLAVMNLTHRMTFLLVWRREGGKAMPGGPLYANNIAGFTFLENPAIERKDGRTYYRIGSQEFTDDEVIAIPGGVDPSDLYRGYAAGIASARWSTLDEYIADFQKGFFQNGAVPAGEFRIIASSKEDYEDTVKKLQEAHRGVGKNNNVVYSPVPIDPETQKPAQAKIEWVPFSSTNKDMDFKTLFEQANKRINATFGVPDSITGIGGSANYASARIEQQNFIRFNIEPLALRIYNQITHELNRITGGFGAYIKVDIKYPAVAEEEKAQAETKEIEGRIIRDAVEAGYTLDSVVDAFDLPERYKLLKTGDSTTTKITNDKPDVDEGKEVKKSPDPNEIDGVTPLNAVENELHCAECDRFLGTTAKAIYEDKLKCSNTKCKVLEVPKVKEKEGGNQ